MWRGDGNVRHPPLVAGISKGKNTGENQTRYYILLVIMFELIGSASFVNTVLGASLHPAPGYTVSAGGGRARAPDIFEDEGLWDGDAPAIDRDIVSGALGRK